MSDAIDELLGQSPNELVGFNDPNYKHKTYQALPLIKIPQYLLKDRKVGLKTYLLPRRQYNRRRRRRRRHRQYRIT